MARNLRVGELVRFRTWDSMAAEHGMAGSCINVKFGFITTMSHLCGQTVRITSIDRSCGAIRVEQDSMTPTLGLGAFTYSADMFERATPSRFATNHGHAK